MLAERFPRQLALEPAGGGREEARGPLSHRTQCVPGPCGPVFLKKLIRSSYLEVPLVEKISPIPSRLVPPVPKKREFGVFQGLPAKLSYGRGLGGGLALPRKKKFFTYMVTLCADVS